MLARRQLAKTESCNNKSCYLLFLRAYSGILIGRIVTKKLYLSGFGSHWKTKHLAVL